MTKPDIGAVRALERFIASQGTPEHLLTFQGILAAHEELYAQVNPPEPADILVPVAEEQEYPTTVVAGPAKSCARCGVEIQRCIAGDHWHHIGVPVDAHFPEPEGEREFGWIWATEWDVDPTKPMARLSMPQVDWERWVADLESKVAPVRVFARPVGSLGPWTEVER